MSQQATQPGATELDANIDALFNQLEPGAGGAGAAQAVAPARVPTAAPVQHASVPEPAMPIERLDEPVAAATEPDALLAEVAGEIERESPSADAALDQSFQAPSADELRMEAAPVAPRAAGEVNVERLDAALAANADKALAAAQDDLGAASEPAAAAPPPQVKVAPKPAPPPAPKKGVTPAPETEVVPELPEPAAIAAAPELEPVVVRERGSRLAAMLEPLRPLAAIHEGLGESTRQTIAYCAVLTVFAASCAWALPMFMRPKPLEPATGEQPFIYNDTIPAHGVTAPHKAEAEEPKAAAHGEGEGGGHGGGGEAKKDAHAKAAKKSSSHGEEAHAEKKSSRAKKPAKGAAEAHGE